MGLQLLTDRARHARRQNAEHRLAWLLRHRRMRGYRFRRQHPVGPFIVDYICIEHALIVEVTADQHVNGQTMESQRRKLLESLGFRVLSLWDSELVSDPRGALTKLLDALAVG